MGIVLMEYLWISPLMITVFLFSFAERLQRFGRHKTKNETVRVWLIAIIPVLKMLGTGTLITFVLMTGSRLNITQENIKDTLFSNYSTSISRIDSNKKKQRESGTLGVVSARTDGIVQKYENKQKISIQHTAAPANNSVSSQNASDWLFGVIGLTLVVLAYLLYQHSRHVMEDMTRISDELQQRRENDLEEASKHLSDMSSSYKRQYNIQSLDFRRLQVYLHLVQLLTTLTPTSDEDHNKRIRQGRIREVLQLFESFDADKIRRALNSVINDPALLQEVVRNPEHEKFLHDLPDHPDLKDDQKLRKLIGELDDTLRQMRNFNETT